MRAAVSPRLMLEVEARAAVELIERLPALRFVLPVNVLFPDRNTVPVPLLVRLELPARTALTVPFCRTNPFVAVSVPVVPLMLPADRVTVPAVVTCVAIFSKPPEMLTFPVVGRLLERAIRYSPL